MKKRLLTGLLFASALILLSLPLLRTHEQPYEVKPARIDLPASPAPTPAVAPTPAPTPASVLADNHWDRPYANPFAGTSLTERVLTAINPKWVEKYEGSHTLEELQANREGGSSFNLNSSWLMPRSEAPRIGILLHKNPAADSYKVRGGEVALPDSGLGIRYETEEDGETRTFLQMEKAF